MADRLITEMNYLMSLVERKFHKNIETSTDFHSLSLEIEDETNERISASTLKRIWGYVNMAPTPRPATLDILAKYISHKDYKTFCDNLRNSKALQSMFFTADFINTGGLEPDARIEIGWDPDRIVTLRHLGDGFFEVESSQNSKLEAGDRFEAAAFIKGSPLYISRILRNGEYTPSYIAGRQGGLKHLKTL